MIFKQRAYILGDRSVAYTLYWYPVDRRGLPESITQFLLVLHPEFRWLDWEFLPAQPA